MNEISLEWRPTLAHRTRLQTDPVTHEPVLLFPEGILVLNETAHQIVAHCDGRKSVREIIDALLAEYEMTREELSVDVLECLRHLHRRKLIDFA